ncbi:MAG: zinc-dependent metalloprotease [Actinobacteria bacterium]|nr:zinc-dependent metalloprotease [Actinomycetota bacterium]
MEHLPAIDWTFAASTGRALVHPGPELSATAIADVVAELRDAASRATGHVAEVTELERPAPAQVLVVDRASWVSAVCQSAQSMMAGAGAGSADSPLAAARARALGAQAGGIFALVSSRILGQFDPFTEAPRLLLVAPNVVAVEQQLHVRPSDFRLWVCLHEETHRFQFGHAPWLRAHLLGLFSELLEGEELEFGWPRAGRPTSVRDLITNPAQREAFDQVTAVMSLMEGHADVMMDRVGTAVVPTYASIRRGFEARRDQRGWGSWVRRLFGFDLKREQYRDGAEFCRQVIDAAGVPTLNRSFEAPGLLPTLAEIHDPQLWLHRI